MDESSVGGIYYGTSFQCIVTTLDGEWKISHGYKIYKNILNEC